MSSINNISLYIPHVFANISKEFVAETFEKLRIGKVFNIDFVNKMGKDGPYNTAYVHFEYWHDNTAAYNFQERVLNPEKEARIIYDEPWYWIVIENKAKKHVLGDRKPCVVLNLQEEDFGTQTYEQMTNKDFSLLMSAPTKKMRIAEALSIIPPAHSEEIETDSERMQELMEEECEHFITIDGRYVEELENEVNFGRANMQYICTLENENQGLKNEIDFLRANLAHLSQRF
jgi:hypothetical protein